MSKATDLIQQVSKDATGQLTTLAGQAGEFIRKHPVTSAVTVGGGVLAATQIIRITKKRKKAAPKKKSKKKTAKRAPRKKSKGSRDWRYASKQKHEVAYRKRRKKLGKKSYQKKYKTSGSKKRVGKIYYTKKGQPYKILANGRARFIKGKRRKR